MIAYNFSNSDAGSDRHQEIREWTGESERRHCEQQTYDSDARESGTFVPNTLLSRRPLAARKRPMGAALSSKTIARTMSNPRSQRRACLAGPDDGAENASSSVVHCGGSLPDCSFTIMRPLEIGGL